MRPQGRRRGAAQGGRLCSSRPLSTGQTEAGCQDPATPTAANTRSGRVPDPAAQAPLSVLLKGIREGLIEEEAELVLEEASGIFQPDKGKTDTSSGGTGREGLGGGKDPGRGVAGPGRRAEGLRNPQKGQERSVGRTGGRETCPGVSAWQDGESGLEGMGGGR